MKLYVVGIGAGGGDGMTLEAKKTLENVQVIVGYTVYAELVRKIFPDKEYFTSPMKEVEVCSVAGVSAMLSGGALVGAPLGHDFAVISLSDLLIPWEVIEKRVLLAAEADMVICLYNPSSRARRGHLAKACDAAGHFRDSKTVCAAAKNVGREGEEYSVMTLAELREYDADMFTTVFIGSSASKIVNGKMVTPRGYKNV